ncbi:hypothetical protein HMPREF9995_12225 [Staphylococcus epidermidis NIHLM095]|nr:hypothetical protein HMPREF9995_12225 [Staphylococcus epidermidis NIHLM095]
MSRQAQAFQIQQARQRQQVHQHQRARVTPIAQVRH